MINAVQQKYKMTVEAETDDGAVGFYRKCGFETEAFMKTYNTGEYKRYKCILRTVQAFSTQQAMSRIYEENE